MVKVFTSTRENYLSKFSSDAQVIVMFFGTKQGVIGGGASREIRAKAAEIASKVNLKDREGRLWMVPGQLEWPPGSPHWNGRPTRSVWFALIPVQQTEFSGGLRSSLRLLDKWLENTGMPLKVAIDADFPYYYGAPRDTQATRHARTMDTIAQLEKYLGRWEVDAYERETP